MAPRDFSHRGLLLLPSLPTALSANSLKVAYGPAETRVIQELAKISADIDAEKSNVILNIAVAYNELSSPSYTRIQKCFALMYRMACIISMQCSVDVQFSNDVDIRIMLFDYADQGQSKRGAPRPNMSFITLEDLAKSQESWSQVFSTESEPGERLLQIFLQSQVTLESGKGHKCDVIRVPGGLTVKLEEDREDRDRPHQFSDEWNVYSSIAVGGTFDHLHAGHKLLLTMTALVLKPIHKSDAPKERWLTIGITGDDLLKNKRYSEELETWEERQGSVQKFLLDFLSSLSVDNVLKSSKTIENPQVHGREVHNDLQSGLHVKYKEIFDPFGPTITDPNITALVISAETRAGGTAVNDKRVEKEWHPLKVFEVDVLDAGADDGEQTENGFESKISSTEIRAKIRQQKLKGDANDKK